MRDIYYYMVYYGEYSEGMDYSSFKRHHVLNVHAGNLDSSYYSGDADLRGTYVSGRHPDYLVLAII